MKRARSASVSASRPAEACSSVELAVSREYLAAYLAVTRPSLSRELSAMQKDGLLKVAGKNLQILDLNRFEEYL